MKASIAPARDAPDLDAARALIREYARFLDHAHCFDTLERELAELPGEYAPPRGCLLLARAAGRAVGCVALRPSQGGCELKRLYVVPSARGEGLGRALTEAALACARDAGHHVVRLETLESMRAARALYRDLGFAEASTGRTDSGAAVLVMELALA